MGWITYIVRDKKTGELLEKFEIYADAFMYVIRCELEDMIDDMFDDNFYEICEVWENDK